MTKTIIQYKEDDLKQLSNQELLSIVKEIPIRFNYLSGYLRKHYKTLYNEILSRTDFLNEFFERKQKSIPLPARLYCLEHNLKEHPRCENPNCSSHGLVDWCRGTQSFRKYCCAECVISDPNHVQKMKDYYMRTLGVPYPLMSKDIQKKTQDSIRKNNGGLGFQSKRINEKIKETNKNRYGNEDIAKTEYWRNQVKSTCNMKFGSDTPFGSQQIQEKCQKTFMRKIGVSYPLMSSEIQNSLREQMVSTHGGLGLSVQDIKQKVMNTCVEKYGVEWYTQSNDYHKNKHHKYKSEKYPGFTFDSTWEIKVYEFCRDNNISIEYQPTISFEYKYDGRIWTYHPDFRINDKIYEVKGDQFFRINESTGKEEMFLPYRNPDWSDEQYEWMCGKFEAKHQCMLNNGVIILRSYLVENISIELFQVH